MNYQITLLPSGETYFADENQSILQAALNNSIMLPHACKSGCCGACKAQLRSGTTRSMQENSAINLTENDQHEILLCCHAPQSNLSIYLPQYSGQTNQVVKKIKARIDHIRICNHYAVIHLQLPSKKTFTYQAGQYIDIILQNGQRRSYSIAGYNANTHQLIIHVRYHEGGAFSAPIFDGRMHCKDMLQIEGPLGSFQLSDQPKDLIMLATGTGLAPLMAMLSCLSEQHFSQNIYLYWGVATEQDLYDAQLLDQLCDQLSYAKWTPVLSRPASDWTGKQGYVQQIALQQHADMSQYLVYACGNPQMIAQAQALFTSQANLATNAFFADNFTPTI